MTQRVFISLARGAQTLVPKVAEDASLAGWLCRSTRNIALNLRRDEFRRHSRERQAMETLNQTTQSSPDWESLRPILDEAMSKLREADYDALVMRYFNNQDLRSVGRALGVTEDAAQKRVSRALDKLRHYLSRRGIRTSTTALSVAISANAVQAAPTGLAIIISTTATAAGVVTPTSAAAAAT
ncbi:MAG TPA: sigma-70 family RNA polymerase sigma factor, partial [Verrucomicrobiae bacterium]|nr:sigma-70 family RNA polymerase sigma factor [Verrucomicrobiae bacterium]